MRLVGGMGGCPYEAGVGWEGVPLLYEAGVWDGRVSL